MREAEDTDKFYQLCKEIMTVEQYLTKFGASFSDYFDDFYETSWLPQSTNYQIYLRLKIADEEPLLGEGHPRQTVWDVIVYGKMYQSWSLKYCYQILEKYGFLEEIWEYIPARLQSQIQAKKLTAS